MKVSPLAPEHYPDLPALEGVRLGSVEAGIKYQERKDLCVLVFDRPAQIAGVFTRSKCPSAAVDWCLQLQADGNGSHARCIVINSGNANAFTGRKGSKAAKETARIAADALECSSEDVWLASTGVIGEPLETNKFERKIDEALDKASAHGWQDASRAIMTTDTYPKLATRSFQVDGKTHLLNGIAKGSGMIAPDMATMLAFLVTDYPASQLALHKALSTRVDTSFNAVSVDSDTSTSDTVLLASTTGTENGCEKVAVAFEDALASIMEELALLIVRDGEGATKQVTINVSGAVSDVSAKTIARSIANSPLVKTAIAGEDANWGRIVMAIGKAGEPADRDRLQIRFGDIVVARDGERVPDYSEEAASAVMRAKEIEIGVDLGLGEGSAHMWTCDLTKEYVAINGDYRS